MPARVDDAVAPPTCVGGRVWADHRERSPRMPITASSITGRRIGGERGGAADQEVECVSGLLMGVLSLAGMVKCSRNRRVRASRGAPNRSARWSLLDDRAVVHVDHARWATWSANDISWVTITEVMPPAASMRIDIEHLAHELGVERRGRLVEQDDRVGSMASARAMATRCCWPPDSSARPLVEVVGEEHLAQMLRRALARRAAWQAHAPCAARSRRCRARSDAETG